MLGGNRFNVNGKGVAWKYKQNPCVHPKQPIINNHIMKEIVTRNCSLILCRNWNMVENKENKASNCGIVATLALGSRLRQGLTRLHAKREAWECKRVRE
jgi:hypothetical protein